MIILSFCVFLAACGTTSHVADAVQVQQSNSTELVKKINELEVGDDITIYSIPLIMDKPKNANLNIDFKIKSAGHCLTSYEPTVFYLNEKVIAKFDFRRYFLKTRIRKQVKLDKNLFIKGVNILKIETGQCQYDIDVLNLDSLKLVL